MKSCERVDLFRECRPRLSWLALSLTIFLSLAGRIAPNPATAQASLPDPIGPQAEKGAKVSPPKAWKVYRNDTHRFSFEYPAVYDEPPYRDRQCGITLLGQDNISVGSRIEVAVLEAKGLALGAFIDKLIKEKEWWLIEDRSQMLVGGRKAISLGYRFSIGRYGRATFVQRGVSIIVIGCSAGVFACDIPERGIYELLYGSDEETVYEHILKSFKCWD